MQQLGKIFLVLIFFAFLKTSEGQIFGTSVKSDSLENDGKKKRKFLFALDARRSFVLNRKTKFTGIKIGATVNNTYKWGLGLYAMENPIRMNGVLLDKEEYPDASDTILFDFNYVSYFFEPILIKTKRWEVSTPFQIGIGSIKLSYRDTTNTKDVLFQKGGSPIVGVSSLAQFKLFRWLALGAGFGYRVIVVKDADVRRSVSAPIYNFQVKILFGEIFKMVFKPNELEEWS